MAFDDREGSRGWDFRDGVHVRGLVGGVDDVDAGTVQDAPELVGEVRVQVEGQVTLCAAKGRFLMTR